MRKLLLTLALIGVALLAPLAPHQQMLQAASARTTVARVIVKYKVDSPLLRAHAQSTSSDRADRAQEMGARIGIPLRTGRGITARSHVVFADGMSSADLARRLAQEGDVEYAVPDERRHIAAAPIVNDPLFVSGPTADVSTQTGGPEVGQWYLQAPSSTLASAIDIEAAWTITPGNPNLPVAVLDTGVRFDHRDLGSKLLSGYDLVGPDQDSSGNLLSSYNVAIDGNGYDADPSDPGDFVTAQEANTSGGQFYHCGDQDDSGAYIGSPSSWHGTQTAGLIGALTDNGIGMASVGRNVPVLPVRVLGKCGGYDSDIQAGMLWAVGASVPGVPTNPKPAKVLSMSLGGSLTSANADAEACSPAYQDAVDSATAAGAVVVVAAGNAAFVGGEPVSVPANCRGVIAVSALRQVGTKVGFSNIGPEVALSAPGGNCVNTDANSPCLYPILTTSNSGATTPVSDAQGGSIYTGSFKNASLGTSFSTPMVAGTAALMLSIQPKLAPDEVRTKLQASSRAFPTTGGSAGIPQCHAPSKDSSGNWVDQEECYCTTGTCGAGMLDAGKAVAYAAGVQARISADSASPTAGAALALSAANSLPPVSGSITSYAWSVTDGGGIVTSIGGANTATASVTPSAAGTFSVKLTATDSNGIVSSASSSYTVTAAPSSGGGGAVDATWLLALLGAVLALIACDRTRPSRRD
jgi:serine protease